MNFSDPRVYELESNDIDNVDINVDNRFKAKKCLAIIIDDYLTNNTVSEGFLPKNEFLVQNDIVTENVENSDIENITKSDNENGDNFFNWKILLK